MVFLTRGRKRIFMEKSCGKCQLANEGCRLSGDIFLKLNISVNNLSACRRMNSVSIMERPHRMCVTRYVLRVTFSALLTAVFISVWLMGEVAYTQEQTTEQNSCIAYHSEFDEENARIVEQWRKSIHEDRGIACEGCHGGDPTSVGDAKSSKAGFIGKPLPTDIPNLCATCHADVRLMRQYSLRTELKLLTLQ